MTSSRVTKLVILFLAFGGHLLVKSGEVVEEATYIDEANGENEPRCISGGVMYPCKTLLYVAESIDRNQSLLTIMIQGPILHINSTVSFVSTNNLTLAGSPTELECDCKDCGIIFNNTEYSTIRYLHFNGCGKVSHWNKNIITAVLIYKCHNVVVENCTFSESFETGLYFRDTVGVVEILNSIFQGSGTCQHCIGASGLAIRFVNKFDTNNDPVSNYTVANCIFRNNRDSSGAAASNPTSTGGGVDLQFTKNSINNVVLFVDVWIEGNLATWGGGMLIHFGGSAQNNQVFLSGVTFRNNTASKAGGGVDAGFVGAASHSPITNTVHMENCDFIDNHASYGAGTAIYASHTDCVKDPDYNNSALVFKSCRWAGNIALFFGSTVDISPFSYDTLGSIYLPRPRFIDCEFTANHTHEQSKQNFLINVGSFAVNAFDVLFEGTVNFENHSFTPLHVTDGAVTFLPGARAFFKNNIGSQGGALALFGSSILQVLPNTTLFFINNTATGYGGAIYQSTQNHHDFFSSRTCFIQNSSKIYHNAYRNAEEKPTLYFRGNCVGHNEQTGHAIYATTFLPCYFEQFRKDSFSEDRVMDALQNIAMFDLEDGTEETALATSPQRFDFSERRLSIIPGRSVRISITVKDELNNTAPSVYRVIQNDTCPTDREFMINRLKINSQEEGPCSLSLVSANFRESLIRFKILLLKCPPGFFMDDASQACSCSAYSRKQAYYGISSCHDQKANAYLRNNYWAGYDDDGSLLTARCPSSFCNAKMDREVQGLTLPDTSSPTDLRKTVCRPNRAGWLCGMCEANYTTYFHSPTYQCRPQHLCSWGVLFYFLSEVFPIVAMFSVIAVFDIRLTTGTASGLVFFAQIIDAITIRMKWDSKQPEILEIFNSIHQVIYGLFNFNFFNLEPASFCLWSNASVLDVIAFKYISVLFAFILLLSIVLFLKYCTCDCLRTKNKVFAVGKNRSVVHSMSAVLVICYAQCTNISFQILTKTTLRGAGSEPRHTVTLYGGIKYFSPEHLVYALAACFCLSTVVAIPPILLLVYPGYLTLFSFCKLSESYPIRFVSSFFIKLKPFFDSFQGCYRDKLRFFSGFYFLGRIAILGIDAFVTSTTQSVLGMEITILILLGVYAFYHPFHNATDNSNNILILLNIALIGLFTQVAYSQDWYDDSRDVVIFALVVRLILLYLPILCIVAYAVKWIVCFFKKGREGGANQNLLEEPKSSHGAVIDHSHLPYQEISIQPSEPPVMELETSGSYRDREELLAYI